MQRKKLSERDSKLPRIALLSQITKIHIIKNETYILKNVVYWLKAITFAAMLRLFLTSLIKRTVLPTDLQMIDGNIMNTYFYFT